ncbi:MAG: hypothetical protein NTV17_07510, partial [Burkholderiales bacterium]|nr:hypothetical protein [Burkholderiales bacterium]
GAPQRRVGALGGEVEIGCSHGVGQDGSVEGQASGVGRWALGVGRWALGVAGQDFAGRALLVGRC